MPRAVMIAYHFPPEGNAGAYRPLRFVRQLPTFGWHPSVVTVDTNCFERYDPGLLSSVPPGVEMIRVRNRDPWQAVQGWRNNRAKARVVQSSPQEVNLIEVAHARPLRSRLRHWVRTLEAWCYQPDSLMGWIRPATQAVVELCTRKKIDVLWATAGPVSSFVAAQRASQQTGVPYVLDFRDAWTISFNAFEALQPGWAQRMAQTSMYRLLKNARAVVFRYATEAECFWRAYPGALDTARIYIIPNGFEGDVEPYQAPAQINKCHILYTGTLGDYRYDTLLQALRSLKDDAPQLTACLHMHFVGEDHDLLGQTVRKLGLDDIVTWAGPVPFERATQLSKAAHALLVLGRHSTMRGYELFAAAKLFGYLKTGRPILGILPKDETRKILHHVGVSTVADVESVPEIIATLRTVLDAWRENRLAALVPALDSCRQFSALSQTVLLVDALAGIAPVSPFVPGQLEVPPSLRATVRPRNGEAGRFAHLLSRQASVTRFSRLWVVVEALSIMTF
jgi:hypothetical protein